MQSYTILGLSNPEKWLVDAKEALNSSHGFRDVLSTISSSANDDIDKILWEESCYELSNEIFDPRIALLSTWKRYNYALKNNGISEQGKGYFLETKMNNFLLSHGFIRSRYWWSKKTQINTTWIDGAAIERTIKELWSESFEQIEKWLADLLLYMNHDYTIHQLWLNTKKDGVVNPIDIILLDHIDTNILSNAIKPGTTEICAAMFHKDILEEANSLGYPVYKNIIRAAVQICERVKDIDDKNLKKYWNNLLRYSLFPSINPDYPEIKQLQEKYPELVLTPNRWSNAIHTPYIISKTWSKVSVHELRKAVINDLNDTIPQWNQTISLLEKK